jgi:Tol biopolymer transport system component
MSRKAEWLLALAIGGLSGCAPTVAGVDWSHWDAASENVAQMQVAVASAHNNRSPAVTPTGRLVFESDRNGNWDIWFVDLKTATNPESARQLTTDPGVDREPSISPDGLSYTFLSWRLGELSPYYFIGHINAPAVTTLVPATEPAIGAWTSGQLSPDGKHFVYSSASYVWQFDLERNTRTQLIEGYAPSWSADGTKIVLRRRARDFGEFVSSSIWMANADGTQLTEVISGSDQVSVDQPRMSPDGRRLCYTRRPVLDGPTGRFGHADVWIANADGTGQVQVTTAPGDDLDCAWYGDDRILFSSDRPIAGSNELGQHWSIWMASLPPMKP